MRNGKVLYLQITVNFWLNLKKVLEIQHVYYRNVNNYFVKTMIYKDKTLHC